MFLIQLRTDGRWATVRTRTDSEDCKRSARYHADRGAHARVWDRINGRVIAEYGPMAAPFGSEHRPFGAYTPPAPVDPPLTAEEAAHFSPAEVATNSPAILRQRLQVAPYVSTDFNGRPI